MRKKMEARPLLNGNRSLQDTLSRPCCIESGISGIYLVHKKWQCYAIAKKDH